MHNRELVVRLHRAHANHIESRYRQAMSVSGNPDGIEILMVGDTKIYLSNRSRFENRAIFTGNETVDELREVIAHFRRKGVNGYFEINPANFYRTEPFSWTSEMVPALLELGCFPSDLRCVWYLEKRHVAERLGLDASIRRFSLNDVDDYIAAKLQVEEVAEEQIERVAAETRRAFSESWVAFVGYDDGRPVSVSELFIHDQIGCLAWGYTARRYRRQGHHRRQVEARGSYAFDADCELVFAVTDFNVPSSLTLQQVGFRLAYNYLLMAWPVGN